MLVAGSCGICPVSGAVIATKMEPVPAELTDDMMLTYEDAGLGMQDRPLIESPVSRRGMTPDSPSLDGSSVTIAPLSPSYMSPSRQQTDECTWADQENAGTSNNCTFPHSTRTCDVEDQCNVTDATIGGDGVEDVKEAARVVSEAGCLPKEFGQPYGENIIGTDGVATFVTSSPFITEPEQEPVVLVEMGLPGTNSCADAVGEVAANTQKDLSATLHIPNVLGGEGQQPATIWRKFWTLLM